jgi:hypothetical protein
LIASGGIVDTETLTGLCCQGLGIVCDVHLCSLPGCNLKYTTDKRASFQISSAILNMALLDCQIQQERLRIWQSEPAKTQSFFKMRIAEISSAF